MDQELTIGALAARSGVAASALRYYESERLIHATRSPSGQRRFRRDTLRRVAFIRVAQQVGLRLDEIRDALSTLPENRTPTVEDWSALSATWRSRIDEQIAMLERLRGRLHHCIGCGCLSLKCCHLLNPEDIIGSHGPGPRRLLEECTGPDPEDYAAYHAAATPAGSG